MNIYRSIVLSIVFLCGGSAVSAMDFVGDGSPMGGACAPYHKDVVRLLVGCSLCDCLRGTILGRDQSLVLFWKGCWSLDGMRLLRLPVRELGPVLVLVVAPG